LGEFTSAQLRKAPKQLMFLLASYLIFLANSRVVTSFTIPCEIARKEKKKALKELSISKMGMR